MTGVKSVSQALADLAKIHDQRAKDYGDDYMHIGKVMAGCFPDGITLKTPEEFNRFALWLFQVSKLGRYARCMTQSRGHKDSLDDISVYAQLLQRFDSVTENQEEEEVPRMIEIAQSDVLEIKENVLKAVNTLLADAGLRLTLKDDEIRLEERREEHEEEKSQDLEHLHARASDLRGMIKLCSTVEARASTKRDLYNLLFKICDLLDHKMMGTPAQDVRLDLIEERRRVVDEIGMLQNGTWS